MTQQCSDDEDCRRRYGRSLQVHCCGEALWSAFALSAAWWGALGEWLGAIDTVAARWTSLNGETRGAEVRAQSEARDREVRQARLVLCAALYVDVEHDYPPEYRDLYGPSFPDLRVKIAKHNPEPILLPRLERFAHPASGTVRRPAGGQQARRESAAIFGAAQRHGTVGQL
jgi:hypothetical protein